MTANHQRVGRVEPLAKPIAHSHILIEGYRFAHPSELRNADAAYIEQIRKAGLYNKIRQAFAVLLPVKTVDVMGDGRTYEYVVGLRAVTSTDGLTADFYAFDMALLGATATRIINEVKGLTGWFMT